MNPQKFTYAFCAWPDERDGFSKATFELFEMLKCKVEFVFTKAEFDEFRMAIRQDGIVLHEIERVPYVEPEAVL